MVAFVALYLIVDLFNRLDVLLRNDASVDASVRYFLFKIPLIVTQIAPAAVITAMLLALGLLARHSEVTALRASGVSLLQSAVPLVGVTLLISLTVLVWNETVVPYCSRQFQHVNKVEIRKRTLRGILSDREIWYHGQGGFYNIAHVDKDKRAIFGLVIYGLDDEFHLDHVIEVASAHWVDGAWQIEGAVEHRLGGSGETTATQPRNDLVIPETLGDFLEVRREPEELSFLLLREWIDRLTRKGIDASNYLVELHLKLAVPFASLVLALVGIPIGGRITRHPSVALIVGLGVVVGFCYWVVLALSQSLGLSGALPPVVAAWSANVLFTLIGVAFFLYAE
jgi:lipopolysaccharide export system permease protein